MIEADLAKIQTDGLVQIAKWINILIISGTGLSCTVSLMKLNGTERFKFGQLEFPIRRFWMLVLAFTIAHGFLTWIFVQKILTIIDLGKSAAGVAWVKLVNSDAFIFYNMRPRIWNTTALHLRGGYIPQAADTAFWLSLAFALTLIVSIVATLPPLAAVSSKQSPSRASEDVKTVAVGPMKTFVTEPMQLFNSFVIGCAFAGANWLIGSQWAISASSLLLLQLSKSGGM